MTIWFDVEDLMFYGQVNPRPSGIQRLSFEIYAALVAMPEADVGFVRHDPLNGTFHTLPWAEIRDSFARIAHGAPPPANRTAAEPRPLTRGRLRGLAGRLPPELRQPLGQAGRAQILALRSGWQALGALPALLRHRAGRSVSSGSVGRDLRELARPGDVLGVLGSPWSYPDYGGLVARTKQATGMRVALLVYDLIPIVRTEFVVAGLAENFTRWFTDCAALADVIFAISQATARDVEQWADRTGTPIARPVIPLPIGTGFADAPAGAAERKALPPGLQPGGYALIVSTIEARKNHLLAFRVWRRLLEEMPPDQVPKLVFAGRVGWMVADLMQQIRNTRHLDGKLVVVEDPTDIELATLYRNCRFTLFPSFYEGWGLPVTESLGFGKVCLGSDRASVPEAGGPFCLYFDPDNVTEATQVIRRAIEEPGLIAGLEARIRSDFRPTTWSETASAVLRHLRPEQAVATPEHSA